LGRLSPFLVAFLISLVFIPLTIYALFYSILVTELVPIDEEGGIPVPAIGDRVTVYGVWVQDTEFSETGFFGGWHEIHPVRFMEINGTPYGEMPYEGDLMDGVWGPSRLIILDKENPYRLVNGTVAEVIRAGDGDYHVHLSVNDEFLQLLRPSVFATSLPLYQILKTLSFTPVAVIIAYLIASFVRPR